MKFKKGDASSFLIAIILMIVFAIVAVFLSWLLKDMFGGMLNDSDINSNAGANTTISTLDLYRPVFFDNYVAWFILGSVFALFIGSIFLDYHPVWFVVFLLVTLMATFLAIQEANIYDEFRADSDLGSIVTEHSLSNALLGQYFPVLVFFTGIVAMIILYGKKNSGGGYV